MGPKPPTSSGELYDAAQVYQLDDTFYIIGGFDGSLTFDTVYEFDPEFFSWILRKERLTTPRRWHGVVPVPNYILMDSY